jgi:hypothetical protein
MELRSALDEYPREAALVGRILAEYGEIEFELSQLVGKVLKDQHQGIRVIFRSRGEETRINVADALLRPEFMRLGIKDAYEAMLGAIRHCKKIRNQYAHAHWTAGFGGPEGLSFADLEESVESKIGSTFVTTYPVDATLLEKQEKYLKYASHWLYHLMDRHDFLTGKSPGPGVEAPKMIEKPSLHR